MPDFDDYLFDHFYIIWRIKEFVKDSFKSVYRFFRHILQKTIRKNHLSDRDIWGISYDMAPYILKRLIAFKEYDRHSYPVEFCNYEEDAGAWKDKEQWEASGCVGGGPDAWEAVIDEMIFAFFFLLAESSEKWRKKFVKRYNLDWEEVHPDNRQEIIHYKDENGNFLVPSIHTEVKPEWKVAFRQVFYHNQKMLHACSERAQKGFALFGKHYFNLSD